MKLPLSVLMYRLSDDYDYETVNVDVSSEYEGIKLFDDETVRNPADGKYLYLISQEDMEQRHGDFLSSPFLSSEVFICLCRDKSSAVCTECRDLSVIFLFADVSFAFIFNRIQNIMKMFDEWEKSFHLSLLHHSSVQHLVDITEKLMTHPLIILDNSYTVLGHSRDMNEVGPVISRIIHQGYASPDDMHDLSSKGIISSLDAFESPKIKSYILPREDVLARKLDRNKFYSITYRFITGGRTVGYAIAFHCFSHPTNGYLYLMNMIAERLQLFFDQEKESETGPEEAYQTLLTGILGNPDMSLKQMNEQAGHIRNFSAEGRFLLAQIKYSGIDEMSSSFISWSLRNSMPHFMPFVYRDCFYILKDCLRENSFRVERAAGESAPEAKGDIFLNEKEKVFFDKCFNNIEYSCGISEPFFSLSQLTTASMQCREALGIGSLEIWQEKDLNGIFLNHNMKKTGGDRQPEEKASERSMFYRYGDVAFVHMLLQLRKVMPQESMESPYYTALEEYDRRRGTDLCQVMVRYIICGGSVTGTAEALYMHRNTILNKLKKAEGIMGIPLEDFSQRVFFIISYLNRIID